MMLAHLLPQSVGVRETRMYVCTHTNIARECLRYDPEVRTYTECAELDQISRDSIRNRSYHFEIYTQFYFVLYCFKARVKFFNVYLIERKKVFIDIYIRILIEILYIILR